MVTYRGPHWSPQSRLSLGTVEKERTSPPGPSSAWGHALHSHGTPTFSPFTFAVTTVPSGLMMTPGSPFSPCKREGSVRVGRGTRLPPQQGCHRHQHLVARQDRGPGP